MQKSDSISNLVKSLTVAQTEFDPVLKGKDNPFFHSKYADLATVVAATQPALIKNGLTIIQFPVSIEGKIGVLTLLAHSSGEYIAESFALPIAKQDPQTGVAAVTYARRTAYLAVIGIAAEDDDGNTAAGRNNDETGQPEVIKRGRPRREVSEAPAENRGSRPNSAEPPLPIQEDGGQPELLPAEIKTETPSLSMPKRDGVLPDIAGLEKYRMAIIDLQKELAEYGSLKPSRGLTISRKVLFYLLQVAGVKEANQITITQWDALFAFIKQIKATDGGITKLAKLIDAAAKTKE